MARLRTVALVAVLAAASVGGWRVGVAERAATTVTVLEVLDGDTVAVRRGATVEHLRLLGVDTPETVHPDRPVECFGPEAAAFTSRHLNGREVRLEFDVVRRDRFGRLLAFVHVDGERFNDRLLARGYARLSVVPPNGRHGRALLSAQLDARRRGLGLWGACEERFEPPP